MSKNKTKQACQESEHTATRSVFMFLECWQEYNLQEESVFSGFYLSGNVSISHTNQVKVKTLRKTGMLFSAKESTWNTKIIKAWTDGRGQSKRNVQNINRNKTIQRNTTMQRINSNRFSENFCIFSFAQAARAFTEC